MSEAVADLASRDAPLKLLLLEDSRFDAELLRENLRSEYPRASLEVVSDEGGFVAALEAGGYDLILSDYELPGYGGGEALRHALAAAPQTPFIFVSGVIGEDNAVEMLKQGATDYVSKGRLARLPVVMERALREVAQRKAQARAETRLREAGDLYARVVDSLRDYAVILLDSDGRICDWNQAAAAIFGYDAGQVMGRSAALLFSAQDRASGVFEAECRKALAQGRASDDRWLVRADGSSFWAEGELSRLSSEQGEAIGFSKIVRDGTQAYRHGQALRDAKEEAERANRAKDRFLAVLSHELRTPLSPIASAAHVLERQATVPEKYAGLLPMIQRNVALEARLIEDLLDLTTISAGKLSLKLERVEMHRLVRSVADMVDEQAAAHRLKLVLELDAPQTVVDADEARIQQVVWNIVRNAVKFSPEGGRIVVRSSVQDGCFVLECSDSGIGIEPAALPRIFKAFEQADAEVSQRFGGLGLGLAIASSLVQEHGGELAVASAGRNQGATFTLRLRLAQLQPAAAGAAQGPAAEQPPGYRLLLVEDNIDAAETMVMCLEAYGYTVTHAATCAAAFTAAGEQAFDLVLTDLGLPDGSGIDIGRALSPRMPVIALSGFGAAQDVQRSASAGFSGHLVKPAEFTAIDAMVRKVLASRGAAAAAP
jgi:PAS domain S-box-containing protein